MKARNLLIGTLFLGSAAFVLSFNTGSGSDLLNGPPKAMLAAAKNTPPPTPMPKGTPVAVLLTASGEYGVGYHYSDSTGTVYNGTSYYASWTQGFVSQKGVTYLFVVNSLSGFNASAHVQIGGYHRCNEMGSSVTCQGSY